MSAGTVSCPHCHLPLPGNLCNTPDLVTCPGCEDRLHLDVFPALFRDTRMGARAESILEAGVSSCFNHEGKKAVASCDGCGRFLCALCEVEINGRHLCPSCLDQSRTKGRHVNLETRRPTYDRAAFVLAVLPVLIWPITLFTAPVAVGCGIFSFFRPGSIVGRSPVRAICGIVLGLAQIVGWIVAFVINP